MHTRLTSQGKWMRRVDVGLVTVELFVKMFLSFQMMCTEGKSLNDSTRRWLQMIWLSSKSLHPSERQSWFSVDYVRTPAGHYRWFNTLYRAHIQVSRGLEDLVCVTYKRILGVLPPHPSPKGAVNVIGCDGCTAVLSQRRMSSRRTSRVDSNMQALLLVRFWVWETDLESNYWLWC